MVFDPSKRHFSVVLHPDKKVQPFCINKDDKDDKIPINSDDCKDCLKENKRRCRVYQDFLDSDLGGKYAGVHLYDDVDDDMEYIR